MEGVVRAWGKILAGYRPNLSIEITRECPLRCPGCYAYGDEHLGGSVTLRELRDARGQTLVDGVLRLVDRHRPLHLSIVGGEPLVRYRELNQLLPILADRGLSAAAEAVAGRSAIRASVDAKLGRRPPPVVETAAYFVITESLTNAAKHAGPDARAHVSIRDGSDRLTLEITDDGRGGANPAGSGLTGLRHRVEALDGTLTVTSAEGHGTVIRAVLPY